MRTTTDEAAHTRADRTRQTLILAGAVILAFLIGAGWQYMRAESLEDQLAETRHELAFTTLEAQLGAAALEAARGSYEVARQLASSFFDGLQERVAATPDAARLHFTAILDQRDAIITGLSRNEPQSGVQLNDLFIRWKSGMGEMEAAAPAER